METSPCWFLIFKFCLLEKTFVSCFCLKIHVNAIMLSDPNFTTDLIFNFYEIKFNLLNWIWLLRLFEVWGFLVELGEGYWVPPYSALTPKWQWSQNSEFCHIYIKCSLSSRHRVLPTTARILSFELIQLQLAWKVYSNTHIYIYTHKTTWTLLTVNSIGHQDSELDTAPFYNQLWMPFQRV